MQQRGPQLENGHTRIANELLEALYQYPLNGTELKVLLLVIRKTYGWGKKFAPVSYSQLAELTSSDFRYVKKVVKKMIEDGLIKRQIIAGKNSLGINKHYDTWRLWITHDPCIQKDTG